MLQEDLDVGTFLNFGSRHLLSHLLRGGLDTDDQSVGESSLSGSLVVGGKHDGFLASHAATEDDDYASGLETAGTNKCGVQL